KFWLSIGPHSPFAAGLSRLHCGAKSLAMPPPAPLSVHVRVVWRFSRINGFRSMSLLLAVSACMYFPMLNFTASNSDMDLNPLIRLNLQTTRTWTDNGAGGG